jgi:hypothetical protein
MSVECPNCGSLKSKYTCLESQLTFGISYADSCQTVECDHCLVQYYIRNGNETIYGHDPKCAIGDSDDPFNVTFEDDEKKREESQSSCSSQCSCESNGEEDSESDGEEGKEKDDRDNTEEKKEA